MKKDIELAEYANHIVAAIPKGVLVTTRHGDRVNSMTIGWGTLGTMWSRPVFIVYIREGRYTRELLDASREFTVNVPYGEGSAKKITAYCGAHSGRDVDKARELGLTLVDSDLVAAPGIAELPLTLECKVLYRQLIDRNEVPEDIRKAMYPEDVPGTNPMCNRDYHVAYFGQIVKSCLLS